MIFRRGIRELGLHYAVGVDPRTTVFLLDPTTGAPGAKVGVRDFAFDLYRCGQFRRCTWRKGTKRDLSARFAACRVLPAHDGMEPLWLLIEWRDGEDEPANYFLSSLPESVSRKQLIKIAMQRWRTERVYEDLKGELGLDHFEGRRFPGWHHHVSVVLCCYAFIVAERARHFPPSTSRSPSGQQVHVAA